MVKLDCCFAQCSSVLSSLDIEVIALPRFGCGTRGHLTVMFYIRLWYQDLQD